jgi:hypothetical protein
MMNTSPDGRTRRVRMMSSTGSVLIIIIFSRLYRFSRFFFLIIFQSAPRSLSAPSTEADGH